MGIQKSLISFLVYTALIVTVCMALPFVFPDYVLFIPDFWVVFCFVGGITFIAMMVALFGIQRKPETGVLAIMGSIVLKLLFSMAFVLVYALKTPTGGRLFVYNFFSLYFLFSGFELYCLLRNLRHPIKK